MTLWFKFCRLLGNLGLFAYQGVRGYAPSWKPVARVRYKDGYISQAMPIGNACDYARMFDGEVIPCTGRKA